MAPSVHSEIPHFFEILKIIEAAVNADRTKVLAYVEQLAEKLSADGHLKAAERLRNTAKQSKLSGLTAASASTLARVPVDNESRLSLADEKRWTDKDVCLVMDEATEEKVSEFVRFVQGADKLAAHGMGITPSLLAYGPPGCGKTELAKWLSAKLQVPLITARIDSLISSYLGSTSKNLRSLFEHASGRPCVLFLDELDAVAKLRDDKHELGELKRVVVSLLQNIDALDQTVLLGATNHEHLLDPAIWRRFAFKVKIGLPNEQTRIALYSKFLEDFSDKQSIRLCGEASDGLSGADIRQIADDSKRSAIMQDKQKAEQGDLMKRIVQRRVPNFGERSIPLGERVAMVRALSEEVFSYRQLADIFDISVGYAHKLVKMGVSDSGG
ncbi:MAG: AAA family ATPase [Candidatus Obscuribacterales bacterium]